MTDAVLIYNALLRAERRFEAMALAEPTGTGREQLRMCQSVVFVIREEVGNGLAEDGR